MLLQSTHDHLRNLTYYKWSVSIILQIKNYIPLFVLFLDYIPLFVLLFVHLDQNPGLMIVERVLLWSKWILVFWWYYATRCWYENKTLLLSNAIDFSIVFYTTIFMETACFFQTYNNKIEFQSQQLNSYASHVNKYNKII